MSPHGKRLPTLELACSYSIFASSCYQNVDGERFVQCIKFSINLRCRQSLVRKAKKKLVWLLNLHSTSSTCFHHDHHDPVLKHYSLFLCSTSAMTCIPKHTVQDSLSLNLMTHIRLIFISAWCNASSSSVFKSHVTCHTKIVLCRLAHADTRWKVSMSILVALFISVVNRTDHSRLLMS